MEPNTSVPVDAERTLPPVGGVTSFTDDLTESILFIRLVEERYTGLVRDRELEGSVLHVGLGQEGVAVGVAAARRYGDVLLSTHRGVAHCLAWGADLAAVTAECFGFAGGLGGGLVGHMHLVDLEHDILGTNGVVGAGLPIAVGAGVALQAQESGRCVIAFFGDGAANTGAAHEALNLAAVWKLPVLFVCENNGFQEMTRSSDLTAGGVLERASAYGMPAVGVDGADATVVREAAADLLRGVRAGNGPALLEASTFRVEGHWVGDMQHYRLDGDRDMGDKRDPLIRAVAAAALDDDDLAALRDRLAGEIESVVQDVLASPRPTADDLLKWASR
jgi:TPP-dependent pyruvate/acetoin dehydrogenase alpha subunit